MVVTEQRSGAKSWFLFLLVTFFCIAGLDFVVNSILYSHGLQFSLVWYIPYLTGIAAVICSICVLVMWQTYVDTGNVSVALKRGLIPILAHIGGLIDWSYFLVYEGGKVPLGEWPWMWQYWLFGAWNCKLQALWSISFLVLIMGLWKTKKNSFEQVWHVTQIKLGFNPINKLTSLTTRQTEEL